MKRKYLWWLLALVWCIFIFMKSNVPAVQSAEESSMITLHINRLIGSIFKVGRDPVSDNFVRKTAHFCEYFILGFILFKAFFNRARLWKTFWLSVTASVLYAVSDEIHQYFIPGRAMRVGDVLIDSGGVLLAALILLRHAMKAGDKTGKLFSGR